MFFKN
ncbi:hypothetical protein D039_3806A, partial [Vibrio parahaemolyticus EKP-028]